MIRFVYNLFWPIGLLFFLPGYLLKMVRRGGYPVSVGEVMIALKLIQQLRTLEPDVHCVLTTTTTTGFALANKNALPRIEVMYTPLDFWPVMRRAFSVIRPARIVLVEAEIWPNLAAEAHARRIPLVLVNARLSPRSERRFRRFQFLVAPTFQLLDLVCVQEPEDVDRWHRLGVERSRIKYTGSIKYDPADFDYTAEAQGPGGVVATSPRYVLPVLDLERPVLFGGSTHRGEEQILTKAFLNLRQKFPSLCLFIAPRHVERVQQIRAQLEALSLDVRVASRVAGDNETKADCVLLDRTGELQRWYSIATVVFIGKSLTAHGGQNPVEPILAGKPVIFGPHMENFATLAKTLVSKNGAIQVSDIDSLERAVDNLLRDSETRQRLVQSAREVLNQHHGATARAAALIADLRSRREPAKE